MPNRSRVSESTERKQNLNLISKLENQDQKQQSLKFSKRNSHQHYLLIEDLKKNHRCHFFENTKLKSKIFKRNKNQRSQLRNQRKKQVLLLQKQPKKCKTNLQTLFKKQNENSQK